MVNIKTTYSGNDLFKFEKFNFGLYWNFPEGNIDCDKTLENYKQMMEKKKDEINAKIKQFGIKIISFKIYSPKAYNFSDDSIDAEIELFDNKLYIEGITKNQIEIQKLLDKNKSYDGYMATTVSSINDEINNIKENKSPDIIILYVLINYTIKHDELFDCVVFEEV